MAFISSKFNVPTYAGSGLANQQAYADELLTKVKDAFISANSAWSLESEIETIGTNTNTGYGCRTLQIKSTSGKYVRIWAFAGSGTIRADFVDSETASGSYNALKIYKGNVCLSNANASSSDYDGVIFGLSNTTELVFGVASHSIDVDFGMDLTLDVPLFSIYNSATNSSSILLNSYSYAELYQHGGTISVMTDGSMFAVIQMLQYSSILSACIYAPDLMVCINPSDTQTAGVISCEDVNNFYLGNATLNSSEGYISVLFNAADGTHDFRGMWIRQDNGKSSLTASESCTKLVTSALQCSLMPVPYSGSTTTGVLDGIGMKGWVNTNYVRSASVDQLPNASKGMTYGNGAWLCTGVGTLICWDSSNSSPFEAAT